jgi:hypothetical protein
MITYGRKLSPRTEYRLRRTEQVKSSPGLSERFPKLKTLCVTADYFDSTGTTRNGGMKYNVNLAHGKSLFCLDCVNPDCAGGDYDLTEQLADAVTEKRKLAEGEMRCAGTRHNKDRKDRPCQSILRYKLVLGY